MMQANISKLVEEFIQKPMKNIIIIINTEVKDVSLFFRCVYDVLPITNPHFTNWIPLIYPKELEIKETTESFLCLIS